MARPYYRMAGYVRPYRSKVRHPGGGGQISGAATAALVVPVALIGIGWLLWKRNTEPAVPVAGIFGDSQGYMMPGMGGVQPGGALPGMGAWGQLVAQAKMTPRVSWLDKIKAAMSGRQPVVMRIQPQGWMPGMGALGFSLKKAVSRVTSSVSSAGPVKFISKIEPGALLTKRVMAVASNPGGPGTAVKGLIKAAGGIDPGVNLTNRLISTAKAHSPLVKRLSRSGQQDTTPPAPGQDIVYQDAYGNTISKYQYDMLVMAISTGQPYQLSDGSWAMPSGVVISDASYRAQMPNSAVPVPGTNTPITSSDAWYPPSGGATGSSSGGGYADPGAYAGGAPTDQAPAAQQQVAYDQAAAPAGAPADKKVNPFIAIGALLAVPVIMGLTGHR